MKQDIIELTKADEDMEGFQFLIRAMVPENYTNKNFCSDFCIKIRDNEAITTDGKRCHIYNPSETYESGVYRVLKRLKAHVVLLKEVETDYKKMFPDFVPSFKKSDNPDCEFEGVFDAFDAGIAQAMTKIIRELPGFQTVNPAYLKDLDDAFICHISKMNTYILFHGTRKKASITTMEYEDILI